MQDQRNRSLPQVGDVPILVLSALIVFLLLFQLPANPFYYESDQLIFLDTAQRMVDGKALYRDLFHFTFPGAVLAYYCSFLAFGTYYWIGPAITFLVTVATSLLAVGIARRCELGPYQYLPILVFICFGFRWFGIAVGPHWAISSLFVLIGLVAALGVGRFRMYLVGAFCALSAFFLQHRGGAAFAGFLAFLAIEAFLRKKTWKQAGGDALRMTGAFTVSIVGLLGYFVWNAGADQFVSMTVIYPVRYYPYYMYNNPSGLFYSLDQAFQSPRSMVSELLPGLFYTIAVPGSLMAFMGLFVVKGRRESWEIWRTPLLIAVVGSAVVFTQFNATHSRWYHTSLPARIPLFWLLRRWSFFSRYEKIISRGAAAALLLFGIVLAVYFQARRDYQPLRTARGTVAVSPESSTEKYLWLKHRATNEDTIFEAPVPYVGFLASLKGCCRYSQFFPTEYTRPEWVSATVAELEIARPKFAVWDEAYNVRDSERPPGDHLGPLNAYINKKYFPTGPQFKVGSRDLRVWTRR